MYQNKAQKDYFAFTIISFIFVCMSFSCSKKNPSVRATVKSQQVNMNQSGDSQAAAQASAFNANYKIASISVPNGSEGGYSVNVELQTPTGEVLPFTTYHNTNYLDSQGSYNDTQRSLRVQVQSRCSASDCFKYTLIVTILRNTQVLFQTTAISFRDDCKFNTTSTSVSIGEYMQSLDQAESRYSHISPKNDIESCTVQ